jgi:pilus assembly protein CpaB
MDARRLVLALVAALVVSAGAVWVFLKYSGFGKPQEQTKDVVVAARKIAAASVLVKDDLTTIKVPQSLQLNGAISNLDDLVKGERVSVYPLEPGDLVLEHDLAAPGSGIGLVTKIPPGMRAVSVRSNEVVGVAGFLYPGSHVDVLATFRPEGNTAPITQTILQDVEVITAGQKSEPDPTGKPETVTVVTLLLSPEDAEKLFLATSQASIQFDLRNGADMDKPVTPAVSTDELTGANPPKKTTEVAQHVGPTRRRPPVTKNEAVAPKTSSSYSVEVYNGDKKSVEKF